MKIEKRILMLSAKVLSPGHFAAEGAAGFFSFLRCCPGVNRGVKRVPQTGQDETFSG